MGDVPSGVTSFLGKLVCASSTSSFYRETRTAEAFLIGRIGPTGLIFRGGTNDVFLLVLRDGTKKAGVCPTPQAVLKKCAAQLAHEKTAQERAGPCPTPQAVLKKCAAQLAHEKTGTKKAGVCPTTPQTVRKKCAAALAHTPKGCRSSDVLRDGTRKAGPCPTKKQGSARLFCVFGGAARLGKLACARLFRTRNTNVRGARG